MILLGCYIPSVSGHGNNNLKVLTANGNMTPTKCASVEPCSVSVAWLCEELVLHALARPFFLENLAMDAWQSFSEDSEDLGKCSNFVMTLALVNAFTG